MANSFVSTNGTLFIPGAYVDYKVQTENSGLGTTGVLILVGEADAGPDYTLEADVESNAFGPDQVSDVQAKYKSGNIVDAFRVATAPSLDPNLTGAPSRIIIVKTNSSSKASGALTAWSGSYPNIEDRSYGALGNLIHYSVVTKTAEVLPTTGSFTFIPAVGTVAYGMRLNGGADISAGTLGANTQPTAFVSAINGIAGVASTGGADRGTVASGTRNLTVAASSNQITITSDSAWAVTPTVGDTLVIPDASAIEDNSANGGADNNANVGAYVITSATSLTIIATKLSDAGKPAAVPGTITAPNAVTPSVSATTAFTCFSPVTITLEAGNPIIGIGKSLEVAELTSGTDLFSRTAYQLNTTPVIWVSKSGTAALLTSAAEYAARLKVNRSFDNVQEELDAGGEIGIKLSYTGTSGSITIDTTAGTWSTTVVGGSGASISTKKLADYKTLGDMVAFLAAQTGYVCTLGTNALGQLPSSALDSGTFTIASTWGASNGRIKIDAYRMAQVVNDESAVIEFTTDPTVGVPQPSSDTFMSGGAKGGTLAANVSAAFTALESVRGNIIVPLFAQDATSDIAAGKTESSSTYTIDAVLALLKDHVARMSTFKRKRNRQGIVGYSGTFTVQKSAAASLASFRCLLAFQDFKGVDSNGDVVQFPPWMSAVDAAAMQLAGFYRGIVKKLINTSGILHAQPSTFNDKNDSNVEDALKSGMLVARRRSSGGYEWVSDQTTYGVDSNFVFNSLQAVYVADVIALATAERMENALVGQSLADISASIGLSFFESIMADFLRLKLIAPSDDAPRGFKKVNIRINGNAMEVSAEVKEATLLYFIPISFTISKIQQSAQG